MTHPALVFISCSLQTPTALIGILGLRYFLLHLKTLPSILKPDIETHAIARAALPSRPGLYPG